MGVQMSLDVKQAEILKLDEKAKQKEEALKKSQLMLDEDVQRFDAFLQANDQKAHKAMKDAENMTKMKQDKLNRIKALKSTLSAIQSEIAKLREQKDECIRYKVFLQEKLTPAEWKEQKRIEKIDRQRSRKEAWIAERQGEIHKRCKEELEMEDRAYEERQKTEKPSRRTDEVKEKERELEKRKKAIRRKYDREAEAVEHDAPEVSSGAEMPLFFEEPRQLLEVFTALEESNLFLIQNSQDTEQALEEMSTKFAEIKRTSDAKTGKMKQNIAHLEKQIADEREKCDVLKQQLSLKRRASEQEQLLGEISEKIAEVHTACGQTSDHDPDALEMLGAVEAKLEEFLAALDEAEIWTKEAGMGNMIESLEKAKEKARRDLVRKQRKDQQTLKIEERLKASLQRSQAPIHKKVGKQIMFRSAPLYQARKEVMKTMALRRLAMSMAHSVFGLIKTVFQTR